MMEEAFTVGEVVGGKPAECHDGAWLKLGSRSEGGFRGFAVLYVGTLPAKISRSGGIK